MYSHVIIRAMESKYEIVRNALLSRLQHSVSYMDGIVIMDAVTMVVGQDGNITEIPLDILSSSVNLQRMWSTTKDPIAIVFRECLDDWYAVIPRNDTLTMWEIQIIPGKGHDLHRARALAERAIQSDFSLSDALVFEHNMYKKKL